jgi:Holliday junction resolvase RusA-like endonuclease
MNKPTEEMAIILEDFINRLCSDVSALRDWKENEPYEQPDLDNYVNNLKDDCNTVIGDIANIAPEEANDD